MIALITPTGGRPKQFELCMKWMRNQTYKGRVFWIVIDDCVPVTTDDLKEDFKDDWIIIKKYPTPTWENGMNTQSRNLQVAVDIIKAFPRSWFKAIFIIEDDDYYKPTYIETMLNHLDTYDVIGQGYTIYYNVVQKIFKQHINMRHSSLFQTCFTINSLPIFEKCFGKKFIDIEFFNRSINKYIFDGEPLSIGIKGLPGREGIGMGHRMNIQSNDVDNSKLKDLIGEDYKYYI